LYAALPWVGNEWSISAASANITSNLGVNVKSKQVTRESLRWKVYRRQVDLNEETCRATNCAVKGFKKRFYGVDNVNNCNALRTGVLTAWRLDLVEVTASIVTSDSQQ
jgi:hypothetical protein